MHSYRKVLYASCFLDLLTTVERFLIMGRSTSIKGILILNFEGPLPQLVASFGWLPDGKLAYFLIPEFFCQIGTLCYCFVPFTYRYFHIVRNKTLNQLQFCLLIAFYLAPSTILSISLPILSSLAFDELTEYVGVGDPQCLRRIPMFNPDFVVTEPIRTISYGFTSVLSLIFAFPPLLIYCVVRIFQKLNADVQKSSTMGSKMQRQVTVALTSQSVVPILFVAIPFFLGIFNHKTMGSFSVMSISINLIPLVNPISTIILVKDYRQTIARAFGIEKHLQSIHRVSVFSSKGSFTGTST
ncbi:unnamed protein product [Bursaphelenchus xylophilus]|uniref:(pine wood nematode) hypothetical protein n=1 Tax=Bursaphelenchus xylophilus TaxID=6326 RepID=A0A7I8XN97_BURXY|nr:unnamed protein product [Bursaphelenchus xylophilus]CAG9089254.1 unnamed protein product [Bursaphelenchus xylophilus]